MRMLIYKWSAFAYNDVLHVFKSLNIEYDEFIYDFEREGHSKHYDEEFVHYFCNTFDTSKYDAIFSIDYWATLSDVANLSGIKYISWSYDCPLDTVDPLRTFGNSCNAIFLFDRAEYQKYKNLGVDTVHHLSLGINEDRYKAYDYRSHKCDKYRTEVSFVGSLYKGNTEGLKSIVSEQSAGIIQKIVDTQKKLQGQYVLDKLVTSAFISALNQEVEVLHPGMIGNFSRDGFINTLAYDVTNYYRLILLMLCAKRFKTDLYTGSSLNEIEGLSVHGKVNYYDDMPWIFAASKVNINHSFISITSGIPLRALDIMASGGFLLSNRQPEFEDCCVEDKEVVLFSSFDEAIEKIEYYLRNEDTRAEIAKAGRSRVFESYSMKDRISEMLNISLKQ